jgi:2'-5' RNA ligase
MEDFFAGVVDRWPAGREDYHWHVLPGTDVLEEHLARPYRELTHGPGLVPVRAEWMHVTVQHVAPVAEIADAELAEITGLVRDSCARIAPFAVTAGLAEAWATGVVCPFWPVSLLRGLWQVTTGAAREVTGGRLGTHPPEYHPHLALAYAVAHVDHRLVRARISDCAAAEVALPVTSLALVAQQHDRREITWRLIDEIPLAGSAQLLSGDAGSAALALPRRPPGLQLAVTPGRRVQPPDSPEILRRVLDGLNRL